MLSLNLCLSWHIVAIINENELINSRQLTSTSRKYLSSAVCLTIEWSVQIRSWVTRKKKKKKNKKEKEKEKKKKKKKK
jgi:hypothetical protein